MFDWFPPGDGPPGLGLPYGRSVRVPDIFVGTVEERFPLLALGDYMLVPRASAPFPVVPLFEMFGEPPPESHLTGDPSMGSVGEEFAEGGVVPIRHLTELRARRDTYTERVTRGLDRMRLLRERQRDALLALPRVLEPSSNPPGTDSLAMFAARFWGGINLFMARALSEGLGDSGGAGGGVLASRSPLGLDAGPADAKAITKLWDWLLVKWSIRETEVSKININRNLRLALAQIVDLQSEWDVLFWETVEMDRVRQLYEIVVGYTVEGARSFPVPVDVPDSGDPPVSVERSVPYPRPERVVVYAASGTKIREDAKWAPLGQWIMNEAMTTALHVTSMKGKADAIADVLQRIMSEGARAGHEEWVVDFARERGIDPKSFQRNALKEVMALDSARELGQRG
jgi:hypothetical protein